MLALLVQAPDPAGQPQARARREREMAETPTDDSSKPALNRVAGRGLTIPGRS